MFPVGFLNTVICAFVFSILATSPATHSLLNFTFPTIPLQVVIRSTSSYNIVNCCFIPGMRIRVRQRMSKHSPLNVLVDDWYYSGLTPMATSSISVSAENPMLDPRLESALLVPLLEPSSVRHCPESSLFDPLLEFSLLIPLLESSCIRTSPGIFFT